MIKLLLITEATRLTQVKHTRIQNTSLFPSLTLIHQATDGAATYYPGASAEISGLGLTAELCKCQKKRKKRKECRSFILHQMFLVKGEREQPFSFPDVAKDLWEMGP